MADKKKEDIWEEVKNDLPGEMYLFVKDVPLVGVITEVRKNIGVNDSTIYTLEEKGGNPISFWGTTILDSRLKGIEPGTEIKILYIGEKKSEKSGRTYHDFKVFQKKIISTTKKSNPPF